MPSPTLLSIVIRPHITGQAAGFVWPFKWLIVVVGCLMVIQGLVEVVRCILCIRDGDWPARLHDVEELEKVILQEAEQQKAEGIVQPELHGGVTQADKSKGTA